MSKIILLLSIFVLALIYSGVYAGCPGQWCHPSQGYGCCNVYKCGQYYIQSSCITLEDAKRTGPMFGK